MRNLEIRIEVSLSKKTRLDFRIYKWNAYIRFLKDSDHTCWTQREVSSLAMVRKLRQYASRSHGDQRECKVENIQSGKDARKMDT